MAARRQPANPPKAAVTAPPGGCNGMRGFPKLVARAVIYALGAHTNSSGTIYAARN